MLDDQVVKYITLPFGDLIEDVCDIIPQLPTGHRYHGSRAINPTIQHGVEFVEIVGNFAREIVLSNNRQLALQADPELTLFRGLGYPIDDMSEKEVDDLITVTDAIVRPVINFFESTYLPSLCKMLTERMYEVAVIDDDLVIKISDSVVADKIKRLRAEIENLKPPALETSSVSELPDLTAMDEYIRRMVATTLGSVADPSLREEVRKLFSNALKNF